MEKKGFMRTVEAVVAVMMVLGFVYVLVPREGGGVEVSGVVEDVKRFVLREVEVNESLRSCVLQAAPGACGVVCGEVQALVDKYAPSGFVGACEVCDSAVSCGVVQLPADRSVYAASVLIASNVTRVVRVFFWER